MPDAPYYKPDLALVHHRGFGFHADACAPGILGHLAPVRERGGTVLELGCGSGLLTRHLVDAGHRVIATDASPAMVELAAATVPDADVRRLTLPDDPLPGADAVVAVGHVLNYLPDTAAIERALIATCAALRPGGVLAIDLCDPRLPYRVSTSSVRFLTLECQQGGSVPIGGSCAGNVSPGPGTDLNQFGRRFVTQRITATQRATSR